MRANGPSATANATTGPDGDWVVTLPPGTYTLSGDDRAHASGPLPCQAASSVALAGGATSSATIYCQQS